MEDQDFVRLWNAFGGGQKLAQLTGQSIGKVNKRAKQLASEGHELNGVAASATEASDTAEKDNAAPQQSASPKKAASSKKSASSKKTAPVEESATTEDTSEDGEGHGEGIAVRARRRTAGMTPEQLARQLGVSAALVLQVEMGEEPLERLGGWSAVLSASGA